MAYTTKFKRVANWGEALVLEVHFNSPGLNPVVEAIRAALGTGIGSRNTFAKLYDCEQPPEGEQERFRAWLVLTALGQDPNDWLIGDDCVPPANDVERLRALVRSQSP